MNTTASTPVVIVGANIAGLSFATALRSGGYPGPITIVTEETEAPYDRPPLSKGFLKDGDADKIRLDTSKLADVTWLKGVRATAIDPAQRTLQLSQGEALPWGTLVLATGARPRTLPLLEALERPVYTLREMGDARALREHLQPGKRLLLVGAGVIGLELAATASQLGMHVTVLESQERVMARGASERLSHHIEERHRQAGVDLQMGRRIAGVHAGEVHLDDGRTLEVDVAVVGIGVQPNVELAQDCGITCRDGILVDGHGRTSLPGVLAVGDVTCQRHPISGELQRIETWSNAQNQAAAAARFWLDPATPAYEDNPWYWSDQYELRIQSAGLPAGKQEVLRGDPASGKFTLLQLDGNRLVGASCVSNPKDFGILRKLVGSTLSATPLQLADPAVDLRKCVA